MHRVMIADNFRPLYEIRSLQWVEACLDRVNDFAVLVCDRFPFQFRLL